MLAPDYSADGLLEAAAGAAWSGRKRRDDARYGDDNKRECNGCQAAGRQVDHSKAPEL